MKLVLTLQAIVLVFSLGFHQTVSAAPLQWNLSEGGNGHFYEIYVAEQPIEWSEANLASQQAGGYLVTILSAEENQWIFSNLLEPIGAEVNYRTYLGGFQTGDTTELSSETSDQGWQWVTGEPWCYENWDEGQPDNNTAFDEDRLNMWYSGKWNDFAEELGDICSFIVEYNQQPIPEPGTIFLLFLGLIVSSQIFSRNR